jgi:predicted secreted Zn-dependent protease
MKMRKPLLIVLFCLMIVQAAYAEVFQYFDEEGTLIVTDNPFGTKKRDRQQYHKKQNRNNDVRLNFREDIAYEFYEVSGKTIHDAMAATDRLGPFDSREGRHYAGQTRWNFGLSYDLDFSYQFDGDSIRVSVQLHDVGFRSDITVILPVLADDNQFEPHDFRAWEDFVQQLAAHEHDHVRIIQEPRFIQEVISGISGIRELTLPNQADENAEAMVKGAIESKVGAVAHDSMRKIKQMNDEYDNLTDHGRKPEQRNAFFQRL